MGPDRQGGNPGTVFGACDVNALFYEIVGQQKHQREYQQVSAAELTFDFETCVQE